MFWAFGVHDVTEHDLNCLCLKLDDIPLSLFAVKCLKSDTLDTAVTAEAGPQECSETDIKGCENGRIIKQQQTKANCNTVGSREHLGERRSCHKFIAVAFFVRGYYMDGRMRRFSDCSSSTTSLSLSISPPLCYE